MKLVMVALGGMIGAILRYGCNTAIQACSANSCIPLGTLTVNAIGCLIIGLVGGYTDQAAGLSEPARLLLVVGILGSFTTFSTFGNETFLLMRNGQFTASLLNIGMQLGVGLLAVWLGYFIPSLISK